VRWPPEAGTGEQPLLARIEAVSIGAAWTAGLARSCNKHNMAMFEQLGGHLFNVARAAETI
jgi:hypothetical protein